MTARHQASRSDLHALVRARRDRYVDMLRMLLSRSAEGEDALQAEVAACFARLGCQVESIASRPNRFALASDFAPPADVPEDERVSVVAVHPGAGDGRSLFLFAHPDGEPVADTDAWQHDPFAGMVAGGRMYGWAIADDLSGVVAMICAHDAIRSAGLELSGPVTYASTVSKRRAQGIYAVLERGYHADAALYLHPAESGAGLADIKSRASGILRFRISISGQLPDTSEPTHTPFSHLCINPIDKAWLVYQAITALDEQRAQRIHHPGYEEVGRSTNLHITHIEAGDAERPGRVSPTAVMTGSLAFPPNEAMADVQRELEATVRQVCEADAWLSRHPAQLDWLQGISGVEVSAESAIYGTVAAAIEDVTGLSPKMQSLHAASEIRTPILFSGIPTLGFGPLSGGNTQSGGTDEWVSVDDFLNMVEVVAKVIVAWCG